MVEEAELVTDADETEVSTDSTDATVVDALSAALEDVAVGGDKVVEDSADCWPLKPLLPIGRVGIEGRKTIVTFFVSVNAAAEELSIGEEVPEFGASLRSALLSRAILATAALTLAVGSASVSAELDEAVESSSEPSTSSSSSTPDMPSSSPLNHIGRITPVSG